MNKCEVCGRILDLHEDSVCHDCYFSDDVANEFEYRDDDFNNIIEEEQW